MGGAGNGKLDAVRWGRGTWTWDGGGGRGDARGRGSGGGGSWGRRMRMGGAGNRKHGAVRGGRGTRRWDGGGARGGARGSGSGGSGVLGGHGGASESGSGAGERLRRGGAVGSVRAGSGCTGGGGGGAPPLAGPGLVAGRVGPVRRRRRVLGGLARCRLALGMGGEVPHPSWICRVGVRRRWRLVVQVEWLSLVGVGPGGPFGVDVVAGRIPFLVWGGRPLVVGGAVGWSARWVVLPSHALVLLVHGGLPPDGVGWWAVVVVVVVVVVVLVWALVAVALVVVVMVLLVRAEDPLAFWWGLGIGHCLEPLWPYGSVDSGGGLGAGLNGDRGRGVPGPRVGLAGSGGGLWGVDDGALGNGDVDEGLVGVVLGGRLCGGGSRWGEGGSGCGGWRVLAWLWVRVWVTTGSLLLPSYLLWFLGLCGVGLVMLLLVVVVVLLLWVVLLFGFRFWFGVVFWVGVRFEVKEDVVPEVRGHRCWVGGFRGVLPGCLGCLCGGRGGTGCLACGCSFRFGRGFVDEVGGEGGFEGGGGGRR